MTQTKHTFRIAAFTAGLLVWAGSNAQVALRNITPASPDSRSILDLDYGGGANPVLGLLIPRMLSSDRTNVTFSPAAAPALLVYQTDAPTTQTQGYWYKDNVTLTWVHLQANPAWQLGGNANTVPGTDFIGTSLGWFQPLAIRTNNVERMRVNNVGVAGVGINTAATAVELLEVNGAVKLTGASSAANNIGTMRYNATTGAHDGNVDGTANWYQLENVFGARVKQAYHVTASSCTYGVGVLNWPLIDNVLAVNAGSSNTLDIPYSDFWEEGRHEYLYLGSDLQNLGICPNQNINGVAFRILSTTGYWDMRNFKIRMKNTVAGNIAAFDDAGLVTCADQTGVCAPLVLTNSAWNAHNFNISPYVWPGLPFNMLVDVSFDNQDWLTYPYQPLVEFEPTTYQATYGQYCDCCGSLFGASLCYWGGCAGVGTVTCPQPTGGPLGAPGCLVTGWSHTGGSAPEPWSTSPMYTNGINLTTCDGTFQFVGTNTSNTKRPTIRLDAPTNSGGGTTRMP